MELRKFRYELVKKTRIGDDGAADGMDHGGLVCVRVFSKSGGTTGLLPQYGSRLCADDECG